MNAAAPSPAVENVPVVGSFAVAAQIRMTTTGTRASLAVAVPQDAQVSPHTLMGLPPLHLTPDL